MNIIDHSSFVDDKGEITFVERIRGTLRHGSSWYADMQAQETVVSRLENALDDSFTLIRNHILPGLDIPIPLTLVGPSGVHVIYASGIKGIYQAHIPLCNKKGVYDIHICIAINIRSNGKKGGWG